jgi:hypothetical protein
MQISSSSIRSHSTDKLASTAAKVVCSRDAPDIGIDIYGQSVRRTGGSQACGEHSYVV